MKKIEIVFLGLLTSAACGKPAESASSSAPETASATSPSHSPSPSGGGAHETRHRGVLVMTASPGVHLHTEAVVTAGGAVQLYLTDAKGAPIPATEASGTVICEGTQAATRTLVAAQDALTAQCPELGGATTVRYQLNVRGTPANGEVKVPVGGTAAMDSPDHASGHHAPSH